MIELYNP
ncbi:hypothetical protein MTR67_040126 [Solanum verrucosum]|nr:hypothetical protein MTR67_023178 [Solanum verrucosum]WMV46741.1 hypothetical protein MTR67_040126 [Solanum verrucosum]